MEKRSIGESDPTNNKAHQSEKDKFLRYLDRLFRNAENDQDKTSLFIKRLVRNSVDVPLRAPRNNLNTELRQDRQLFNQPEKIVEAERSQLINPGDVLVEVAKAAAHDVAIEGVYEKRAEIRNDSIGQDGNRSKVAALGEPTITSVMNHNLDIADNLIVPKPPLSTSGAIKQYFVHYQTSIRNGFLAGLVFFIILLVLMLFIDR